MFPFCCMISRKNKLYWLCKSRECVKHNEWFPYCWILKLWLVSSLSIVSPKFPSSTEIPWFYVWQKEKKITSQILCLKFWRRAFWDTLTWYIKSYFCSRTPLRRQPCGWRHNRKEHWRPRVSPKNPQVPHTSRKVVLSLNNLRCKRSSIPPHTRMHIIIYMEECLRGGGKRRELCGKNFCAAGPRGLLNRSLRVRREFWDTRSLFLKGFPI